MMLDTPVYVVEPHFLGLLTRLLYRCRQRTGLCGVHFPPPWHCWTLPCFPGLDSEALTFHPSRAAQPLATLLRRYHEDSSGPRASLAGVDIWNVGPPGFSRLSVRCGLSGSGWWKCSGCKRLDDSFVGHCVRRYGLLENVCRGQV
jgi:hypothetical protein